MKALFYISFLLLLIGCTPDPVDIEIEPVESQYVVYSQVVPGISTTVLLSKTIGALEYSEENADSATSDSIEQAILNESFIGGAEVTLSYRDQVDTLYEASNGLYSSIGTPHFPNEFYTLNIKTPDNKILTSTSTMLPLVEYDTVHPVIEGDFVRLHVAFSDEASEDNWYMLNVYKPSSDTTEDTVNVGVFDNGNSVLIHSEIMSDLTLENNLYDDTLNLWEVELTDTVIVTLSNINEDYFKFLDLQQRAGSNVVSILTREPVSYPSNINGGYGFFNTHFPSIRDIDLNEF